MSTMEELRSLLAAMQNRVVNAEKHAASAEMHAIEVEKCTADKRFADAEARNKELVRENETLVREIKTLVRQKEASTKHIKGLENRFKIITRNVKKLKKALTAMHIKKCAADAKEVARFEGMFKHLEGDMFR
jgi:cell division protein FtsB